MTVTATEPTRSFEGIRDEITAFSEPHRVSLAKGISTDIGVEVVQPRRRRRQLHRNDTQRIRLDVSPDPRIVIPEVVVVGVGLLVEVVWCAIHHADRSIA